CAPVPVRSRPLAIARQVRVVEVRQGNRRTDAPLDGRTRRSHSPCEHGGAAQEFPHRSRIARGDRGREPQHDLGGSWLHSAAEGCRRPYATWKSESRIREISPRVSSSWTSVACLAASASRLSRAVRIALCRGSDRAWVFGSLLLN